MRWILYCFIDQSNGTYCHCWWQGDFKAFWATRCYCYWQRVWKCIFKPVWIHIVHQRMRFDLSVVTSPYRFPLFYLLWIGNSFTCVLESSCFIRSPLCVPLWISPCADVFHNRGFLLLHWLSICMPLIVLVLQFGKNDVIAVFPTFLGILF